MKTTHLFILFCIVVCIQLFIPAQMIWDQESILTSGTKFKFKTRPIDPSDPFRGKYIHLNYELNRAKVKDTTMVTGDRIYVYFRKDANGFAQLDGISKELLKTEKEYVITFVNYVIEDVIHFRLPFESFYMEESKAKEAEIATQRFNRNDSLTNVYAEVYIKNGNSVLQNVFINEMPLQQYVEKQRLLSE